MDLDSRRLSFPSFPPRNMGSRSGSPDGTSPPSAKRRKHSPSSYSSPHSHHSSPSTGAKKGNPWRIFLKNLRPFPTGVGVRDIGFKQIKSKHGNNTSETPEKRGGAVVDSEDDYTEVDVDGPDGHVHMKTEHHSSHRASTPDADDKSIERLIDFLQDLDENFKAIENDLATARGILRAVISSSSPSEPVVKKRKAEELEAE